MSLAPAALHRRHRGRTRGHGGIAPSYIPIPATILLPAIVPIPAIVPAQLCRAPPPHTCKVNHSAALCQPYPQHPPTHPRAHLALPLPRPITLPRNREHGAHREPCWDVPGCRIGRRLLLERSQRPRFQPQRELCRTTPRPVSHIPQPGAPAVPPHPLRTAGRVSRCLRSPPALTADGHTAQTSPAPSLSCLAPAGTKR